VIPGWDQLRLTQETGKGLFAMDGVQIFSVLRLSPQGRGMHHGAGKLRKNGLPCFFFFRGAHAYRPARDAESPRAADRPRVAIVASRGRHEANFLKEMLKNMRKTVQESPEMKNNRGFQIFRGMLDEQYAEIAAKTQGIGLAEIIVNQVLDMQGAQENRAPVVRELNESDVIKK
jgi:hypothetical protein